MLGGILNGIWRIFIGSIVVGEISLGSHYYLKDLKCVHYACCGKDYGKEDQTLFIDDKPSEALRNLKWTSLFLELFRGQMLSNNKV
jgi:hypothetical protein